MKLNFEMHLHTRGYLHTIKEQEIETISQVHEKEFSLKACKDKECLSKCIIIQLQENH